MYTIIHMYLIFHILGKLFRTSDLPMIVEFILMFHKDKPIDWLLDHILWVKVCNPEKDSVSLGLYIFFLLVCFSVRLV